MTYIRPYPSPRNQLQHSRIQSPIQMGLVRKLLLFAVAEGLVLAPLQSSPRSRSGAPLLIDYESHGIRPWRTVIDDHAEKERGLEVYGIIGLLRVASEAYVIGISRRKEVARIWGKPVYVITGVVIVPLGSQEDAQTALKREKRAGARRYEEELSSGELNEEVALDEEAAYESLDDRASEDEKGMFGHSRRVSIDKRAPGIAEEVLGMKGLYRGFADRWFSRRGWTVGQRLGNGLEDGEQDFAVKSSDDALKSDSDLNITEEDDAYQRWPQTPGVEKRLEDALPSANSSLTSSLLPKLIQTTKLLFDSRTFYFSYDYDITRNLATQRQTPSDLPLHREVDPEYFWNNHLLQPFIDNGLSDFSLPIMQGFVGQREFALEKGKTVVKHSHTATNNIETATPSPGVQSIPIESSTSSEDPDDSHTFLLTLISRRSTKRCGLRYLRRGIDEQGNVANAVETEQILSSPTWKSTGKAYSFVQTRGSVPLFFSQLPYNFKPPPLLQASPEANQVAIKKHFSALSTRYGAVRAISLVDKHEPEVVIGNAYESAITTLKSTTTDSGLTFEWFPFHQICRGMKFENVSQLIDSTATFLLSSSFTTLESSKLATKQTGIIRTNCMDCLDRTNVVQSALAQHILSTQLADAGLAINLSTDPSTIWFNALWADNGDAISRAYTGTSALKGDYTRTRKRNALGALTDLTLTLSRYYHNLFDDFFAQAVIDFLLGVTSEAVFAEFEATMTTADPAIDLPRAREAAVASAANVVVETNEDLIDGWTLLVPALPDSRRALPLSEAILLLSNTALYLVRFDWNAHKVSSFERMGLKSVSGLQMGTYITETHTPAQVDGGRNVGFLVRFRGINTGDKVVRVNTRSLESARDAWSVSGADGHSEDGRGLEYGVNFANKDKEERTFSFKALAVWSAAGSGRKRVSEKEAVKRICEEIRGAVESLRKTEGQGAIEALVVEEKDVLSLEEARRSTGIVESLAYSFKKALWG